MNGKDADYWYKVVGMLQQNWAVILQNDDGKCVIQFFGDTGGVFDSLTYGTQADAKAALQRNGFLRYEEDPEANKFIAKPHGPLHPESHPNGKIYSSGRFWNG